MGMIWHRKLTICAALCFLFVLILGSKVHAITEVKLLASDGDGGDFFGNSVAISADVTLVGSHYNDHNGDHSGAAYVFRKNGNSWVQEQKLVASDGASNDEFGCSVAISGDVALVGTESDEDNNRYSAGSAYVFRFNGDNWVEEKKLVASDGEAYDYFGVAVAISGDIAIVGAWGDDDNGISAGAAYIFRHNESNWTEEQKLLASDGAAYNNYGSSVAISGNVALVGAYGDDDNGSLSGSAYVFRFDGYSWVQEQKLVASDSAANDNFSNSVAINGDVALVGAYGANSAYLFRFNSSTWIQEQKLVPAEGHTGTFGHSVAISDDVALVGASRDSVYRDGIYVDVAGSAYVFRFDDGNSWVQKQKLIASDAEISDRFGYSVAVNGDKALVGAYRNDDFGYDTGSAYVFDLKGKTMPWIQLLLLGE